jgi:hypothetical protein
MPPWYKQKQVRDENVSRQRFDAATLSDALLPVTVQQQHRVADGNMATVPRTNAQQRGMRRFRARQMPGSLGGLVHW